MKTEWIQRAKWGMAALLLTACGFSPWPDRDPIQTNGLPTGDLKFYPGPRLYLKPGESLQVKISGIVTGYACTQIQSLDLKPDLDLSAAGGPVYVSAIKALVPSLPDCAQENGRDTVVTFAINLPGGKKVWLANSEQDLTDSTSTAVGTWHSDLLLQTKSDSGITASGRYVFTDSSSTGNGFLTADSLPACAALSSAWARRKQDSVFVNVQWVEQDPAAQDLAFPCRDSGYRDSLPVTFYDSL